MHPREIWNPQTIIIETGLRDGVAGAALLHEGLTNYLGVAFDDEGAETASSAYPELAPCIVKAPRASTMARNNAEVLILSGKTPLYLWKYRTVRFAGAVAWNASLHPISLLATLACLVYRAIFGRYSLPVLVECQAPDGSVRRLFVSKVLRRKSRTAALHFVPHALGVGRLFQQFERFGVKYAVLRWFDKLPSIRPGKDIDMLVDDDSIELVFSIMDSQPGIQATDVYTPSGLPKSDFYHTPYYPPASARLLLSRTARHVNFCRVPSPLDHFHSLAYHAVYHNGGRSGLPSRTGAIQSLPDPKHDYVVVLGEMARALGLQVEITLEGLHEYLQLAGWAPQSDMLARMAAHYLRNAWLKHLAGRLEPHVRDAGLTVFCIRQKAADHGFTERILNLLSDGGWQLLAVKHLNPDEVAQATLRTRGGNWDKGFYKSSAGPPAVIVVAYDCDPQPVRSRKLRRAPVANSRLELKDTIRAAINAELPPEEECSSLHSSDYAGEAWYFIDVCLPERRAELQARIEALHQQKSAPTRRAA